MSGYADPDRPGQRLSDAERDEAVGHLASAQSEGRLTPAEFEQRSAAARSAVTRADLAPLFADLPPIAPGSPSVAPVPPPGPSPAYAGLPSSTTTGWDAAPPPPPSQRRSRALGGRVGDTVMALSPFVALLLFFGFGFWTPGGFAWSWLWFFLIPITGIIVYGGAATERNR